MPALLQVNIVSWLCPPGQDILRVIDYVVSVCRGAHAAWGPRSAVSSTPYICCTQGRGRGEQAATVTDFGADIAHPAQRSNRHRRERLSRCRLS